ncbi:MAG: hypothetical protein AAB429_03665 [Patescibacteria group bacterium]
MNHHDSQRQLGTIIAFVFAILIVLSGAIWYALTRDGVEVVPETTNVQSAEDAVARKWPVYITTMTHLEGDWLEAASNEVFFDRQAGLVRHGLDIAEEYDAVLTIESEIPMALGMKRFGDNLLAEALARGHGVGTHCDISAKTRFTDVEMAAEFERRTTLIDALVGEENNLGCSGGGGYSDWYAGAVGAGLAYIDGGVGYHYLALPLSARPKGWTDKAIIKDYFHDPAPQNAEQFFHPFRIGALGFDEDEDGKLLMSGGALPRVDNFAEVGGFALHEQVDCPRGGCPFTQDDVTMIAEFVREFALDDDRTRPAKITFYFATEAFDNDNDAVLRSFFAAMRELVEDELVEWASQREVYETMEEYYAD